MRSDKENFKMFACIIQHFASVVTGSALFLGAVLFSQSAFALPKCESMQYSIDLSVDGVVLGGTHDAKLAFLPDSPFKQFALSVSEHVLGRLGAAAKCQDTTRFGRRVHLALYQRALIAPPSSGQIAAAVPCGEISGSTCSLESPWVNVSTMPGSNKIEHIAVVWSERQLLLDQALMSGASARKIESVSSLTQGALDRYVEDYSKSVLEAPSPQSREMAQGVIADRIPPDLLWLLRHAWQSTRGPFSDAVDDARAATLVRVATGYADLVKALIDRCVDSELKKTRYSNILDLKGSKVLERYRLDEIH
jgi:hypothetical protein